MSWLYSIVLAGLLFSSGNDSISRSEADITSVDTPQVSKIDETEKFEQSYPLNANGRVSVSNINGSVVVEAWDRNEVKLEATKIADSKESLAAVEIQVNSRPEAFSVEANYNNWKHRGNTGDRKMGRRIEVEFHLFVPRGAELNEVETVNGSVTVSDFVNVTKISAVNGLVKATNLRGTADLSTVNGEVLADFDRLEAGSRISLSTVNGSVSLTIPSDSNATLKADSVNGSITNDFGLPVRKGKYVGRDLYGRIGAGDVQIKLDSVNGGLSISRKNDGRNLNPATDLLPQKGTADDDWDQDGTVGTNIGKMNADAAKALKQSRKDVASALKEAEKEMAKVKPTLEKINLDALRAAASEIERAGVQGAVRADLEASMGELARLGNITFSGTMPRIVVKTGKFPVKGIPKVSIESRGCSITVRGWDKPEVQYSISQYSSRRKDTPVEVKEDHTDGSVALRVFNNVQGERDRSLFESSDTVRIDVFVPKHSNLKIVTDKDIRVENISGEIDLDGDDESINVRESDGKLKIASNGGLIRVIGFAGDVNSTSSGGDVYLEGAFANLSGRAADGKIYLTLPEEANVELTSNGSVTSEGIQLVKLTETSWRIGKGGSKYDFHFDGGGLVVRNSLSMSAY